MRRLMVLIFALSCGGPVFGANTATQPLEPLFEAGRYSEFLAMSKSLAEKGDADAQFLLGKAYHLGRGVDVDLAKAVDHYKAAAAQNHARAENNLGAILLEHDRDLRAALLHFERALELGLEQPTARNVRMIRLELCQVERDEKMCIAAGADYTQAWKTENDNEMLDRAVTAYAAACGIVHHFRKPGQDSSAKAEPIPVCAHAADLAEIGSGHGLARASHNRGAIDHDAERYVDALKWFTRAYEQGFALSALAIGTMYALGQGVPKDDGEALIWFTRAAERKDALALPEQGTR